MKHLFLSVALFTLLFLAASTPAHAGQAIAGPGEGSGFNSDSTIGTWTFNGVLDYTKTLMISVYNYSFGTNALRIRHRPTGAYWDAPVFTLASIRQYTNGGVLVSTVYQTSIGPGTIIFDPSDTYTTPPGVGGVPTTNNLNLRVESGGDVVYSGAF